MGKRILMVEDEPDFAELARKILEPKGYEVAWARSIAEGRSALSRGAPDLVLLDLHLPDGDGLELLRECRSRPETERLPFLILTVRKTEEDIVDGLGLGADDYLVKSFSPEGLLARVGALLRRTVAAFVLAWFAAAPASAMGAEAEASRLSAELTATVERVVGEGRGRVLVTLEGTFSSKERVIERVGAREGSSEKKASRWSWSEKSGGRSILPGYREGLREKASLPGPKRIDTKTTGPDFVLSRQRISVLLDQAVSEEQATAIQKMIGNMVDFDEARGDLLDVYRMNLAPTSTPVEPASSESGGFSWLWGIVLLAIGYFVGGRHSRGSSRIPERSSNASAASLASALREAPSKTEEVSDPPFDEAGGPLGLPGPGLATFGEKTPWAFLREAGEEVAAEALEAESAPSAALALGDLAREDLSAAAKIFSRFEPARQLELATELAATRDKDPQALWEIEERLRSRLERGLPGARSLGDIISRLAPERREWLLGEVRRKSPDAAQRIEDEMLTFEHLADQPKEILDRLVSEVGDEAWGLALHGMPDPFTVKVLERFEPARRETIQKVLHDVVFGEGVLSARAEILSKAEAAGARRR